MEAGRQGRRSRRREGRNRSRWSRIRDRQNELGSRSKGRSNT